MKIRFRIQKFNFKVFMWLSAAILITELTEAKKLARLESDKISSIFYVLAAPQGSLESSHGHAYLRFSYNFQGPTSQDIILNAGAVGFDQSLLSYIRGLGLFPLSREIKLVPFLQVKQEVTMYENRSLTSYELKLSKEQMFLIAEKVNELLDAKDQGNYSYLVQNCATTISELLRISGIQTDSELFGFSENLPTWIPVALRKQGLIKKTYIDDSAKEKNRISLFLNRNQLQHLSLEFYKNFEQILNSSKDTERVFGYIAILQKLPLNEKPQDTEKLLLLLNELVLREPDYLRVQLVPLVLAAFRNRTNPSPLTQSDNFLKIPLLAQFDSRRKIVFTNFYKIPKLSEEKIECDQSHCNMLLRFQSGATRGETSIPLHQWIVRESNIYYNNHWLGLVLPANDLVPDQTTVLPSLSPLISVTPNETTEALPLNSNSIKPEAFLDISFLFEQIVFNNFSNLNSIIIKLRNNVEGLPQCESLVTLQKHFINNSLFAPQLPKQSAEKNLDLLLSLIQGQFVVIPGYHSPEEFTADLKNHKTALAIFAQREETGERSSLRSTFNFLFEESKFGMAELEATQRLTQLGIPVPIYFFAQELIRHSFLILNVSDNNSYFNLEGFDPNRGYVKNLMQIQKINFSIRAPGYGVNDAISSGLTIRPMDLDTILFFKKIRQNPIKEFLVSFAHKNQKFVFSKTELNQIFFQHH